MYSQVFLKVYIFGTSILKEMSPLQRVKESLMNAGLSLRAKGQGIPVTMNVAPSYFHRKQKKSLTV